MEPCGLTGAGGFVWLEGCPERARPMTIHVSFYSYFKELTGTARTSEWLADGSTLADLQAQLVGRFPKLAAMEKSTLMAVGVEYQPREYVLREGDEVSLFPPVQGG